MKYFNLNSINKAISNIREGNITREHVTGEAGTTLAGHYFPASLFTIAPEEVQSSTKKRPDLAIKRYVAENDTLIPHCYVEFKSLVGKSINQIPDQLFKTLFLTIDDLGLATDNFSVFMVAMKGTKIAFYMYHSFAPLLDESGIFNYKGFIPVNYLISKEDYNNYISPNLLPLADNIYDRYSEKMSAFTTDAGQLHRMGALETGKINHPHVMDLVHENHKEDIHSM